MSSNFSYADHDVHHVRHDVGFLASADSGPTVAYEDVQQFEITERGLDPDELAELRAMVVHCSVGSVVDNSEQDTASCIDAQFECGFNLSGDEFLFDFGSADSTNIDTDDSGTPDFRSAVRDTDEVGQLFHGRLFAYPGYRTDVSSTGGGGAGGMPVLRDTYVFDDLTGTGPVVDAVDDFSSRVALDVNNSVVGLTASASYQLFYAVEESDSGRTRFGR